MRFLKKSPDRHQGKSSVFKLWYINVLGVWGGGSNPPFRVYSSPLYQILTIFLSLIIPLPEGNLSCKGDGGGQPILVSLKNFNLRLEKDVIYRKVVGLRCYFLRKCGRVGFFRVIIYRDFFNKNIIFGFYQETQLA